MKKTTNKLKKSRPIWSWGRGAIYLLFLSLLIGITAQSQSISASVVGNAGSTLSDGSHSISFTVGETLINLVSNGESISQGFWNGASAGETLSISTVADKIAILAYPNPVSETLYIQTDRAQSYDMHLIDMSGKLVARGSGTSVLEELPMARLRAGVYMLQLRFRESEHTQTFKIIKN